MKKFVMILLMAMVVGCATKPEVVRVTDENRAEVEGLHFYMPKPLLCVAHKDIIVDGLKEVKEEGSVKQSKVQKMAIPRSELVASIIYIQNTQEEYVITNFTDETEFRLIYGWRFEGFKNKPTMHDEEVLKLLTGMPDLTPGMYDIVFDKDRLVGIKKVKVIY